MPLNNLIKKLKLQQLPDIAELQMQYLPLLELQKRHRLLDIRLGHKELPYQSMILGFDFMEGLMTLDELFPKVTDKMKLPGQLVQVKAQDAGAIIRFDSMILSGSNDSNVKLKLPKEITRNQRRNAFRITLGSRQKSLVRLITNDDIEFVGNLIDISANGARIGISEPIPPEIRRGSIFPKLKLVINNDITLQCGFDVRNLKQSTSPGAYTTLGGNFMFLPAKEGRSLSRFISRTDRERRKITFAVA